MAGRGLVGGIIGGEEFRKPLPFPGAHLQDRMAGSDILLFEEGMPH